MKKVILVVLCCITFLSCQSQGKVDLETIDFAKNYKEILKDTKFQTDASEIVTNLPVAYTKEVSHYKFGDVSFVNSKEDAIKSSMVGILINNSTERLTKGIKMEVEETSLSNELLSYLKKKYSTPKILSEIPKKNNEGKVLGNSAYSWNSGKNAIILIQYYEYTNNKPNISSVLYILDNKVTIPNTQDNVVERVIKTYNP